MALRSRPASPLLFFWPAALVVLVLDQITKGLVVRKMLLFQSIPILDKILQLTYVRNTGAAFSLLTHPAAASWRIYFLSAVAVITVIVLATMAYREKDAKPAFLITLGMVSGGAAGNLVDRVTSGTVVDFIEVSYRAFHFPVFNLADSAVVIGVGWLLLKTFHKRA